jgi:hypothetical protein
MERSRRHHLKRSITADYEATLLIVCTVMVAKRSVPPHYLRAPNRSTKSTAV